MGDSHVRRMQVHHSVVAEHLSKVKVDWLYQGGAGISYAEQQSHNTRGYRMVILMVGSNDLANGLSPQQLADRVSHWAASIIQQYNVETVVLTSPWPRANKAYNTSLRQYVSIMERRFFGNPEITYWLWDRRQPTRTYDGVHLEQGGYKKAVIYLIAAIIWVINHNLW